MLFLIALALAIFVLPRPWGVVAVGIGAMLDIAETSVFWWWSKRRRAVVGAETLVGTIGVASSNLWPDGQVKVSGEIWGARCPGGCDAGTKIVVRSVDGLTLVVDPA